MTRVHHNTLNSLKASIVVQFADMPREESTIAWSHLRSRIQRVTETEVGTIDFFLFSPSLYIIFR